MDTKIDRIRIMYEQEKAATAIKKKDLVVGQWYKGPDFRNGDRGKWNGTQFEYKRTKFGNTFIDYIDHFEDDKGYDVFFPMEALAESA